MDVHGIWLGGAPHPRLVECCIKTWGPARVWTQLAELKTHRYFNEAMEARHWAGASDVMRLHLLHKFGGVYLDTDVELLNYNLMQKLWFEAQTVETAVLGAEEHDLSISKDICGAVIVAPKGNAFVKYLMDVYEKLAFKDTFQGTVNGTTIITQAAGLTELERHRRILPAGAFYPWSWRENLNGAEKAERITEHESICAHHWDGSWVQN